MQVRAPQFPWGPALTQWNFKMVSVDWLDVRGLGLVGELGLSSNSVGVFWLNHKNDSIKPKSVLSFKSSELKCVGRCNLLLTI